MFLVIYYVIGYDSHLFLKRDADQRDLHVLTHSFPTRRSSDLQSTGRKLRSGDRRRMPPCRCRLLRCHPEANEGEVRPWVDSYAYPTRRIPAKDRKSTRLNSSP